MSQPEISLDCSACKTQQSMKATTVPRFGGFIRFLGVIIVIPSVLGVATAILFFVKTTSDAATAGAALGAGFSAFFGATSLVVGLVGWLLLSSRKVYKCVRCSFILERA